MTWPRSGNEPAARAADGVVALGEVIAAAELPALRAAYDAIIVDGVRSEFGVIVHDPWRHVPALAALLPRLGPLAAALTGTDEIILFHDHLIAKLPGGGGVPWHQDYSYLPLDRPDGLTMWITLDDAGLDDGCLSYVPGTHELGERQAQWGMVGDDDPRARLPPLEPARLHDARPVEVTAGGALAHHTLVWHSSGANTSGRPRRAWALSWVSPSARWLPSHAPHPRTAITAPPAGAPLDDDLPRFAR